MQIEGDWIYIYNYSRDNERRYNFENEQKNGDG
jgi:hypothetical protein